MVTRQELVVEPWAAILGLESSVGTDDSVDVPNRATPVTRYGSDFQYVPSSSEESTPSTTSTLPPSSAAAGSLPTSMISTFRPIWSAR